MFDSIKNKHGHNPLFHAALLAGFALISAVLLILGDKVTSGAIKQRHIEDLKHSLEQVIPASLHDNDMWRDKIEIRQDGQHPPRLVYLARRGGKLAGVAFEVSGRGYNGKITLLMGIDADGRILGVRVLSHTETPGLGDKINERKSNWIFNFDGKSLGSPPPDQWKVKKDGGAFDQLSGATITPRAVVKAVREGLEFFKAQRKTLRRSTKGEPR